MKLADPAHVAEQYRDSARFDARVRIYELYDTSPEPWLRWLFDRLSLAPGERVLEVDAGAMNAIRAHVERQIELSGSFHVGISAGVVQARKP